MPDPRPPYVVKLDHDKECPACGRGRLHDVVDTRTDTALAKSWHDADEAEWICDQMNAAWLFGWHTANEPAPAAKPLERLEIPTSEARAGWSARFFVANERKQVQPYADPGGAIPLSMPVIANSMGDFPAVWLPDGSYTVALTDPWGNLPQQQLLLCTEIPF